MRSSNSGVVAVVALVALTEIEVVACRCSVVAEVVIAAVVVVVV